MDPKSEDGVAVLATEADAAIEVKAEAAPAPAAAPAASASWSGALQPVARRLAKALGRPIEVRRFERQIQQYMEDMLSARTPSARRLRVDLILWLAQAERGPDPAPQHPTAA